MSPPERPVQGRVFISYRREDAAYPAGWLFDRLTEHLGEDQVFKDVDSIELGDDFVEAITHAVGRCDVLLAVIGDRWLSIAGSDGRRRLDKPDDFVRREIEAALVRQVLVIPVLVDGATMPPETDLPTSLAPLARRQALELTPDRFAEDTDRLLSVLDRTLSDVRSGRTGEMAAPPPDPSPGTLHRPEPEPEPQALPQPLPQPPPRPVTGARDPGGSPATTARPGRVFLATAAAAAVVATVIGAVVGLTGGDGGGDGGTASATQGPSSSSGITSEPDSSQTGATSTATSAKTATCAGATLPPRPVVDGLNGDEQVAFTAFQNFVDLLASFQPRVDNTVAYEQMKALYPDLTAKFKDPSSTRAGYSGMEADYLLSPVVVSRDPLTFKLVSVVYDNETSKTPCRTRQLCVKAVYDTSARVMTWYRWSAKPRDFNGEWVSPQTVLDTLETEQGPVADYLRGCPV